MKTVAVIQSNYIPWKGYFDIIHDVDEFIFHDDVQYTKQDWRNRNIIQTNAGPKWVTVPVGDQTKKRICDVYIPDSKWQREHLNIIAHNYSKAPYYNEFKEFLEHIFLEAKWTSLSEFNQYVIKTISKDFLGINTVFSDSRNYNASGVKHEKLLNLLKSAKAEVYVSGPAAKDYIMADDYTKSGIELVWKDYGGYPEYAQSVSVPFNHYVSIIDLLMNTGANAPYYIWGWRNTK